MKSKTSFFNKTVFKKNLTRFAPVMAVYTLCLILGMMMLYQNNEEMGRTFWFASRIAGNLQLMGLVNLLFAPLVAMLLSGDLFDSDSHCMVNLKTAHVSVVEKDTGRSVICNVEGYPYVLIWSAAKKPLHFICIEPWHSLPGEENGPLEWEQRPCAASLKKGESWSTTLSTTFVR